MANTNMSIEYEDISQEVTYSSEQSTDNISISHDPEPSVPVEQTSPPPETERHAQNESHLLTSVIQREEKRNCLFEIQFSTVLCVGLPKAEKTSFCNLLMGKGTQVVSSGNTHTIFIKKSTPSAPDKESKWKEINSEELMRILDDLNRYKTTSESLHVKHNKKQGIINDGEKWEVLLLLDCNIPSSALSLLQPSVVTFVTYKMLGGDFSFTDPCTFIKSENKFPKFVKELLACSCITRESKFNELKISEEYGDNKTSNIVFVGIMNDSSSSESYEKEKDVINRSLHIVEKHINCSSCEFPLSFWYVGEDTYLRLVNLAEQKEQSIENLRKDLDKETAQNSAHKLPITWILFYFMLCKLCFESKTSYAYYNVVFETLWKAGCCNLDENELKLVLHFFHNLGVLFYFDTVEGLKDYVFIDCLWIFEKLKYLLSDFEDSKHDYYSKRVFKHEGLLQSKLIKQIDFEGPGNMKLQTFVNLLRHLKYIAPLNQNGYFIPSKLECYKSNLDIFKQYGSLQSKPLLVTFSSGSIHRSVFCYLAAYMMQINKWGELKFKKQQHTFKDLIIFSIGVEQYVCISDKIFFLEINLLSNSKSHINWHYSMFKFIQDALGNVCQDLQLSASDCKYGFLCHGCEDGADDHMMVVEEYKESCAYCCKINKPKKLSLSYTVWFERSNSLPSPVHGQATDNVAEEVESLPGRLTTGISNPKSGNVMYEPDSQSAHPKVSNPVESLPSRLTTGISNPKNGDVMYELDSQSAHPKVSNPVESLPGRFTTEISNPKNGDVMYEPDSQSAHPKVSNPGENNEVVVTSKEATDNGIPKKPPTLRQLLDFQNSIGRKWFNLGEKLLGDKNTVNKLKKDHPPNKRCSEMFRLWLQWKPSPSWETLITTLKEIGLDGVAKEILEKYHDGNMNTQAYYSEPVEKDFYQYGRRYTQMGSRLGPQMVTGHQYSKPLMRSRVSSNALAPDGSSYDRQPYSAHTVGPASDEGMVFR